MVRVVDVTKIDEEGRVAIPKKIRERKKLDGEIELVETDDGVSTILCAIHKKSSGRDFGTFFLK